MNFINLIQIILIFFSTTISAFLALFALLFSKEASFIVAKNIWARSLCIIARCNIITKGINDLKDIEEPVIFCANHLSNFDIIALYMAIDRPVYFIAKKELNKIPFLGWYMKAAGMVFIDRTNQTKSIHSLKEAGDLIRKGRNIITFPEGTRSQNGDMSTFKKGSFIISKKGNIPVVPVAIKNSNHINPNNSFLLNKGTIKVSFGKIIDNLSEFKNPLELASYTKKEVEKLYLEL